jgi:hypothetical protein
MRMGLSGRKLACQEVLAASAAHVVQHELGHGNGCACADVTACCPAGVMHAIWPAADGDDAAVQLHPQQQPAGGIVAVVSTQRFALQAGRTVQDPAGWIVVTVPVHMLHT